MGIIVLGCSRAVCLTLCGLIIFVYTDQNVLSKLSPLLDPEQPDWTQKLTLHTNGSYISYGNTYLLMYRRVTNCNENPQLNMILLHVIFSSLETLQPAQSLL